VPRHAPDRARSTSDFASQVRATLERECGGFVDLPAAGALLRDRVFRPAAATRWDRLVAQATGEPLSAAAYAADLRA